MYYFLCLKEAEPYVTCATRRCIVEFPCPPPPPKKKFDNDNIKKNWNWKINLWIEALHGKWLIKDNNVGHETDNCIAKEYLWWGINIPPDYKYQKCLKITSIFQMLDTTHFTNSCLELYMPTAQSCPIWTNLQHEIISSHLKISKCGRLKTN